MDATRDRRVAEIVARPYTVCVERGEDGVYTAWLLEIPGALGEGDTSDEAIADLHDGLPDLIAVMLAQSQAIPEPYRDQHYSGRLQLRIAPTLHRRAALYAQQQGVSLNHMLSDAVATYVAGASTEPVPNDGAPARRTSKSPRGTTTRARRAS